MYKESVFRYKVSNLDLIIPGEDTIELTPDTIIEMQIDNDYDTNFFPIFRLNMNTSLKYVYKIINNLNTAQLHIRILVQEYKDGKALSTTKSEIINKNFIIFMDDPTPELQAQLNKMTNKTTSNNLVDAQSVVEFFLFDPIYLYNSKTPINYVLKDCKIFDAISFMFMKSNINRVLLTPIENTEVYKQIIIPPTDLLGGIKFIENVYGIYSTYSTLFFDFKRAYLLNRKNKTIAKERGEKTRISLEVKKSGEEYSIASSTSENDSGYSINLDINAVKIIDNSNVNNAIYGNDISNIDLYTGECTNVQSTYIKPTVKKSATRLTTSTYQNKFALDASKYDMEENIITLSFGIKDNNVNLFTPNKDYVLSFQEVDKHKSYSGYYRLSGMSYSLVKDGDTFRVTTGVILKKSPVEK